MVIEDGRATGVDFSLGEGKPVQRVTASREVLVCAGAFQSPQILQLSGIGDPQMLAAHGIAPVLERQGVGANLQDHLDVSHITKNKLEAVWITGVAHSSESYFIGDRMGQWLHGGPCRRASARRSLPQSLQDGWRDRPGQAN